MVVLSIQISGSLAVGLDLMPFLRNGWDWRGLWALVRVSVACVSPRMQSQPARQHEDACPRDAGMSQPRQEPLCMHQFQNRTLALKAGHQPDSKHAPATSSYPKPSTIIPFSFMINCNFSQTFNNHYSLPTPPIFACISM